MTCETFWCLELRLQPLSELLIRQVGKSNVQWFSYPFLPPTTFSGFVASLLADDRKNYIESNDYQVREVRTLLPEVFSVGAYPDPALVRRNRHYRQHFGDVYNYEEYAWVGNKKLAVVEYFWVPELRGFLLAKNQEQLRQITDTVTYKVTRVGKKGAIKIKTTIGPYKLTKSCEEKGIVPSTIAPLEMLREFLVDVEILYVPLKVLEVSHKRKRLVRAVYPCVFGQKIYGEVYVDGECKTVIPEALVNLIM